MKILNIKKSNILYFEDTKAEDIYVLKSGKLYLRKENEEFYFKNGELTSKIIIQAGDMFGFREVFLHMKRESRAVAIDDCEIIVFDVNEFSDFLKKNVKVGKRVISSLSTDIREISNRIKKISDHKKPATLGSGKLYDIYLYFLRSNEFTRAFQVLNRMIVNGREVEFANAEKERIESFLEFEALDISTATLDNAIEVYKNEPEILKYLLIGFKVNVSNQTTYEKLLLEIINLKISINDLKNNFSELEEFIKKFPGSEFFKDMIFLLLDLYKSRREYVKAYHVTHMLTETTLSDEEKIKFKDTVNFLKKVAGTKGSGKHV